MKNSNDEIVKAIRSGVFIACVYTLLPGCAAPLVAATGVATGAAIIDNRTAGTLVEDETIERKAKARLRENKEVKKQVHINFTSYNTRLLISGEAPSERLRQQIVDMVKDIEKVSHIHNEVTIAAPSSLWNRSGDTTITARVKTKLLKEKNLDGFNIKIVTENGTVFMMGLISREASNRASDIARTTGGVQRVVKLFEYTD